MGAHEELRQVCFMVMPFREKDVTGPTGESAPKKVNCDALWDKAFRPAIEAAGFTPIRADFDTGTVIVKDMLERLAFADLVLADVSLPNGNVYYEVGLRHVARKTGCIMVAADWSRQLFDIDQFTSARYALKDGSVSDEEAKAISVVVTKAINSLKNSPTPWHEFIAGENNDDAMRNVFRESAAKLSAFQADVRAVRLSSSNDRKAKVEALRDQLPEAALEIADVAIEMLYLIRDELDWQSVIDFTDALSKTVRKIPVIQEQRLLAVANTGEPEAAIASLEELNKLHGETPERLGLIGGRYKRVWRALREQREGEGGDRPSVEEKRSLNRAIEAYTKGMELDYNQFYCSCNIAQLLAARGREGDAERAVVVDHFVVAACERAIARGEDDGWTRPTLLGAAFRARDVRKAEDLAMRILDEGAANWKLETAIADLEEAVRQAAEMPEAETLTEICDDLKTLLPEN